MKIISLIIMMVVTSATTFAQSTLEYVKFSNPQSNKHFITGQYEPIIYGSTSGGTIPSGSSSLVLQAGSTLENRHIFFRTRDETRLFIHNNGNVGIGTENPGNYRLAVEGKIGAREVNVTTSGWSDYVLYDDYKLPSLLDVESYIKQNKHLPEVPSEAEVKENGINLGEMNVLLLKKVEELTLYILLQQKQLDRQNNEIEKLRRDIKK